jgi:hypothetical protein
MEAPTTFHSPTFLSNHRLPTDQNFARGRTQLTTWRQTPQLVLFAIVIKFSRRDFNLKRLVLQWMSWHIASCEQSLRLFLTPFVMSVLDDVSSMMLVSEISFDSPVL